MADKINNPLEQPGKEVSRDSGTPSPTQGAGEATFKEQLAAQRAAFQHDDSLKEKGAMGEGAAAGAVLNERETSPGAFDKTAAIQHLEEQLIRQGGIGTLDNSGNLVVRNEQGLITEKFDPASKLVEQFKYDGKEVTSYTGPDGHAHERFKGNPDVWVDMNAHKVDAIQPQIEYKDGRPIIHGVNDKGDKPKEDVIDPDGYNRTKAKEAEDAIKNQPGNLHHDKEGHVIEPKMSKPPTAQEIKDHEKWKRWVEKYIELADSMPPTYPQEKGVTPRDANEKAVEQPLGGEVNDKPKDPYDFKVAAAVEADLAKQPGNLHHDAQGHVTEPKMSKPPTQQEIQDHEKWKRFVEEYTEKKGEAPPAGGPAED